MHPELYELAACRKAPKDVFFPVARGGKISPKRIEAARTYCLRCPIRRECLAEGQSRAETSGIWGGELIEPATSRGRRTRRKAA